MNSFLEKIKGRPRIAEGTAYTILFAMGFCHLLKQGVLIRRKAVPEGRPLSASRQSEGQPKASVAPNIARGLFVVGLAKETCNEVQHDNYHILRNSSCEMTSESTMEMPSDCRP